jgi:hypothetical protein
MKMTEAEREALADALMAIASVLLDIAPGNIGDLDDLSEAIRRLQSAGCKPSDNKAER